MKPLSALPLLAALGLSVLCGCGKAPAPATNAGEAHLHHNQAPHGGTVVALGEGQFAIELVLEPTAGTLQAYLLDDELENFVRSPSHSIKLLASTGTTSQSVILEAVANPATGETAGDTALFEGRAEWLKTTTGFDGMLESIDVRGSTFTNVKFHFPKADDASH